MSRRWIVTTLLLLSCCVASADAQHAGKSLIDRLPFLQDDQPTPPQPARYVRPAPGQVRPSQGHIVQTAGTTPRAPRDRSGQSRSNGGGSGRSLLSRFSLSNLLPGRDEPPVEAEEATDYPLPYEPPTAQAQQSSQRQPARRPQSAAGATAQQGGSANAHATTSQPLIVSDQQRITQRRAVAAPSPNARQGSPPQNVGPTGRPQQILNPAMRPSSSAASAPTAPRAAAMSRPITPTANSPKGASGPGADAQRAGQTVRQSPTLDLRRGELQDALADLRDPQASSPRQPTIELPSAADETALPSYLESQEKTPQATASKGATAAANPVSQRMRKVDSLDLSDALLGRAEQRSVPADANSLRTSRQSPTSASPSASPTTADLSVESSDDAESAGAQFAQPKSVDPPATPVRAERRVASASDFGAGLSQWASSGSRSATGSAPAETASNQLRASSTGNDSKASRGDSSNADAGLSIDPQLGGGAGSRASDDAADGDSPVLFRYRQPLIASRVEGPRQVVVGQTATYQVVLINSGDTPARELEAQVAIPAWAELVDAAAVNGRVEILEPEADEKVQIVRWQLYELPPSEQQLLELTLIPRDGRSLKLGVRWSHAPVGGETLVDVQEPKLQLDLNGPAEVLFGKPQRYQLSLSNPGDGVAENVHLVLTPPGADASEAMRHTVGALAPGQTKSIELELTPRDAGDLEILAAAVADGGLEASSVKKILCRRPLLEVDWRGPEKKYAGAMATYYIRVRNPGTASTEAVDVSVALPPGVELISASDGHSVDRRRNEIVWRTASLQPAQERFMQVRCRLTNPGATEFTLLAATPEGELSDERSIRTEVVALADLKMEVSDPKGPVAVGQDAVYEVVIRNRGTTAAAGVDVIALFSEGIEPTSVDGRQHQVHDGRVTFRPIDYLPAGEEVTLKIHAAASKAGSHVFRAEVSCPELDVRLSAEEVTRFFDDEQQWDTASKAYDELPDDSQRY